MKPAAGPGNKLSVIQIKELMMPYNDVSDLPDSVRNALPKKAQEIFLAAYNNAWDQYDSADKRKGDSSREEAAFKVAWSAVKKKYEKKGDTWKKK